MPNTPIRQKLFLVLFGFALCLVLLEIGLHIWGFVFLSIQEYRNKLSLRQKGVYRILCLGESTTVGGQDAYPTQLQEILNQKDIGVKFSVINKGIPGIDTGGILSQLKNNLGKYNPDMVITMMGINDGENTVAYEDIPTGRAPPFFKSLRTYKLLKLLQIHIIDKANELVIYKLRKKEKNINFKIDIPTQIDDFKERERKLKASIETNPKDAKVYFELVNLYFNNRVYDPIEEILEKNTEINLGNDQAYAMLGWWYNQNGQYIKAEGVLKKALEINSENILANYELRRNYRLKGEWHKTEEILKKILETNPEKYWAYFELAYLYINHREYDKAEEIFRKGMEVSPESDFDFAYFELGRWYRLKRKYDEAEKMLKKAIEKKDQRAYVELGQLYRERGEYNKAEEIIKKAISEEVYPVSNWVYAILELLYEEQGKEAHFIKENILGLGYHNPVTRHNYQKLKETLNQRGIKFVCVQYPVRPIGPLKKIFNNKNSIIFVDNEEPFKKILKVASHDEYFVDLFGGDFGHCTEKGNRLLAENIAQVILKECFNRY